MHNTQHYHKRPHLDYPYLGLPDEDNNSDEYIENLQI